MICMICTIQLMSPGGTRKNPRDLYQVVCFYWLNLRCASPTRPRNKRKGMELESRLRTVDADLLKDVNRFKDDVHLRARGFRRKLTLFARFFWYFDRATFGAGGRAGGRIGGVQDPAKVRGRECDCNQYSLHLR